MRQNSKFCRFDPELGQGEGRAYLEIVRLTSSEKMQSEQVACIYPVFRQKHVDGARQLAVIFDAVASVSSARNFSDFFLLFFPILIYS